MEAVGAPRNLLLLLATAYLSINLASSMLEGSHGGAAPAPASVGATEPAPVVTPAPARSGVRVVGNDGTELSVSLLDGDGHPIAATLSGPRQLHFAFCSA